MCLMWDDMICESRGEARNLLWGGVLQKKTSVPVVWYPNWTHPTPLKHGVFETFIVSMGTHKTMDPPLSANR